MALRLLPLASIEGPREHLLCSASGVPRLRLHPFSLRPLPPCLSAKLLLPLQLSNRRHRETLVSVGKEELQVSDSAGQELEPSPDDLECIGQVNRVLELLKKNRDMTFGEVKLTIMIEDPREVERKRLLGIDLDEVTREDMVSALDDVKEGRVPENRLALRLLAEELLQWPNLEIEAAESKARPGKSLYARATDIGVDPQEAAKRLNMDWDSAADIENEEESDEVPVPPAVGYGALYLVTAFPLLIGVSVVLILFYNSLQ